MSKKNKKQQKAKTAAKPAANPAKSAPPPSPFSAKREDHGDELLSWAVTPVLYDRKKGVILVGSILAFVALVYYSYRDWYWPTITLLLLVFSSSSFLFPNNYSLTSKGVVFRNGVTATFKPWSAFSRYKVANDGVYLTLEKTIRTRILGPGLFLYFGEADKERIVETVTANLDAVSNGQG